MERKNVKALHWVTGMCTTKEWDKQLKERVDESHFQVRKPPNTCLHYPFDVFLAPS